MIEQAKEELEILETQHPNRFEYLKHELKSFISLLESHESPISVAAAITPTTTAMTEDGQGETYPLMNIVVCAESSTRKKRKRSSSKRDQQTAKQKLLRIDNQKIMDGDGSGVDAAIQKAKACLHKIQQFKTSF